MEKFEKLVLVLDSESRRHFEENNMLLEREVELSGLFESIGNKP